MGYFKIKEAAQKAGVSIRTLRYYDQIGLFKPSSVSQAGYRLYTEEDLRTLKKILLFKELGFSLEEIKTVLKNLHVEKLDIQKKELMLKRKQLEEIIYTMEICQTVKLINMPELLNPIKETVQVPMGALSSEDERFAAIEMPFLYNNIYACIAAQKELLPLYSNICEEKFNMKVLTYWVVPPMEIASKSKPITSLEDCYNLKFLSIAPPITPIIKCLGGLPISVSWKEGFSFVQKGLADATIQSTINMVEQSLYDTFKYLTICNFILGTVLLTIKLDTWEQLPGKIQDVVLQECQTLGKMQNEYYIRKTEENLINLSRHGMEIIILDEKERIRWSEEMRPNCEKLIQNIGEFGQKLKKIVEKANRNYPHIYEKHAP